jgi:hypothetical protein
VPGISNEAEKEELMSTATIFRKITSGNLVAQIAIGIVAGIALLLVWPEGAARTMLLGDLSKVSHGQRARVASVSVPHLSPLPRCNCIGPLEVQET